MGNSPSWQRLELWGLLFENRSMKSWCSYRFDVLLTTWSRQTSTRLRGGTKGSLHTPYLPLRNSLSQNRVICIPVSGTFVTV